MKLTWPIYPMTCLLAVCSVSRAQPFDELRTESRVALVIGNGDYQDGRLRNLPNDARAMTQALKECRFRVTERIVSLPGGTSMEFLWIEPGTFMMGSSDLDEMAFDREKPQHRVTINQGFYLGKYEVTQKQWQAVMGTQPWAGMDYVQPNPNHPAVYISWNNVQAFICKLNQAEGREVYRLPMEAEWEYACRGGTTTRWSFGDDESQLGEYAWYEDNAWNVGLKYAQPVGTKRPNPWGLFDMHGNCWEWVQDWYGNYSSGSQVDPTGSASGFSRVIRGGGFSYDVRFMRSALRYRRTPGARHHSVGFRLSSTGPWPDGGGARMLLQCLWSRPGLSSCADMDRPNSEILRRLIDPKRFDGMPANVLYGF